MTQEDVELFIARYDRDNDRKISFLEFSMAFSPIDPFYKEKLVLMTEKVKECIQNKMTDWDDHYLD